MPDAIGMIYVSHHACSSEADIISNLDTLERNLYDRVFTWVLKNGQDLEWIKMKNRSRGFSKMEKCKASCGGDMKSTGWLHRSMEDKEERSHGESWKFPHEQAGALGPPETKSDLPAQFCAGESTHQRFSIST